jgi:hypothetical protein
LQRLSSAACAPHAPQRRRWRDFLRLVAYSFLENFGYCQAITFYRVRGFFKYVRGDQDWAEIARRGYADEYVQPQVGGR